MNYYPEGFGNEAWRCVMGVFELPFSDETDFEAAIMSFRKGLESLDTERFARFRFQTDTSALIGKLTDSAKPAMDCNRFICEMRLREPGWDFSYFQTEDGRICLPTRTMDGNRDGISVVYVIARRKETHP